MGMLETKEKVIGMSNCETCNHNFIEAFVPSCTQQPKLSPVGLCCGSRTATAGSAGGGTCSSPPTCPSHWGQQSLTHLGQSLGQPQPLLLTSGPPVLPQQPEQEHPKESIAMK